MKMNASAKVAARPTKPMTALDIERRVEQISRQAFDKHRRNSSSLFSFLRETSGQLNAAQFELYRDNYFFRTQSTLPSLKALHERAHQAGDEDAARSLRDTIRDEEGEGDPAQAHPALLEHSHNVHASTAFGLAPSSLAAAASSPSLLDEARQFRTTQEDLYCSGPYPTALGAFLAQETAADGMLREFYETLFLPYKERYHRSRESFAGVSWYFECHLNGTEQQHARRAKLMVSQTCRTAADVSAFREGIRSFLSAQARLWQALHRSMARAG